MVRLFESDKECLYIRYIYKIYMTKLITFNMDTELIKQIDNTIDKSNFKYRDRTQFLIIAIQELLKKENRK